mgnify:FL=1
MTSVEHSDENQEKHKSFKKEKNFYWPVTIGQYDFITGGKFLYKIKISEDKLTVYAPNDKTHDYVQRHHLRASNVTFSTNSIKIKKLNDESKKILIAIAGVEELWEVVFSLQRASETNLQ